MKRILFYAFMMLLGASVLSCDDNDSSKSDNTGKSMKPDEQKSYLENVAIEFTQKTSSSEFLDLKRFFQDLGEIYEDYSWSLVEENMMDGLDAGMVLISEDSTVSSYSNWTDGYYNYFYDVTLALSNFTGHYTASDGTWRYTEASDLQFNFQDAEGEECILKLTKEGKETVLRLPYSEKTRETDYTVDYSSGTPYYYDYYYYYYLDFLVSVPEKINVSLKRGANAVITATVMPSLNGLTKNGYFDVAKSSLNSRAQIVLDNGYNLSYSGVSDANSKFSTSVTLSNSTGELISYSISADPSGLPSIVISEDLDEDDVLDDLDEDDRANIKNFNVSISILNKAQIKGTIADVRPFVYLTDEMNDYLKNGDKFKEKLKKWNSMIDLGLYYNGSAKRQALFQMEAFCEVEEYNGKREEYWYAQPVMVFSDGTKMSCEAFFDEDDFEKAIDALDKWSQKYDRLFND